MKKLPALLFATIFVCSSLAGCINNSSASEEEIPENITELEQTLSDLNSTLEELNQTIVQLREGWSQANDTISEFRENMSDSNAAIVSLIEGWANSNLTIADLTYQWDSTNYTLSQVESDFDTINQTIFSLQQSIQQANSEILLLKMGWESANSTLQEFATGWTNANETLLFYQYGWSITNQTLESLRLEWQIQNYSSITPQRIPQYRGSWTNPIHSSNTSRSNIFNCLSEDGWKSVDAETTVNILEATGQNLYLMGSQKVEDSIGSNCTWDNIERIMTEIDNSNSNIETMTVMPDFYNVEEYNGIINETKNMSEIYPNLIGVTIDDFNQAMTSPSDLTGTNGITATDVQSMYNLAHKNDSMHGAEIDFLPYFSGSELPLYYMTDTILFGMVGCGENCILSNGSEGVDGDFYLYPEDDLILNATFETPFEYAGVQTEISFMISENLKNAPYTMDIVFEINGQQIGSYSMVDNSESNSVMSVLRFTIPPLNAGDLNDIGMRIDTNGTTVTKYQNKLAYMWDFRIGPGESSSFPVTLANVTETTTRGVVQNRPIYQLDSFIASTNDNWRITNYTDGVLFKYPSRVDHYDVDTHSRFVRAACDVSNSIDSPCIEVYWGNDQWTSDVIGSRANPHYDTYMESSIDYADGIIFWMLDLNLYDRSLGKLIQRDVKNSNMQTAIGFAAETSPSPGYYHQWSLVIKVPGNYSISFNTETNVPSGTIFHTINVDGVRVYDLDCADTANGGVYTVNLSKNDKLIIKSELINGYSAKYYYSEWNISSDVMEISLSDLHHTSGVSSSTEYMYDTIVSYFLEWSSIEIANMG